MSQSSDTKRPGTIITFYSYKGGTGRSMAMANVAYILATDRAYSGKKILMIDWDLEAPGLYRYFEEDFSAKSSFRSRDSHAGRFDQAQGLIEFLEAAAKIYQERDPSGELPESNAHRPEAVEIFEEVRRITGFDNYILPVGEIPNLYLLKAGCEDADYSNRVRKFDWEGFYNKYGSFFPHFRKHLMDEYAYILIDSRTGLTDTSGICTRVMPEKLVGVFAPNRQNIEGLTNVIRMADAYRRDSRGERGLVTFPLASRLDNNSSRRRMAWWLGGSLGTQKVVGYQRTFEELFMDLFDLDRQECDLHEYFDVTQIPHDSDYAFGEEIAARLGTTDKLSIGAACANLTKRLVTLQAPWESLPEDIDLKSVKRQAEEATHETGVLKETLVRRRRIAIAFGIIFLVLALIGLVTVWQSSKRDAAAAAARQAEGYNNLGSLEVTKQNYRAAYDAFSKAIDTKPDYADPYLNRAGIHLKEKQVEPPERALADYSAAIRLNPNLAQAYFERADIYSESASTSTLALADYNNAIKLKPDYWNAFLNRGFLYESLKNFDSAIADYNKVIDSNSEEFRPGAYLRRGTTYKTIGNNELATKDLLAAVLTDDPSVRKDAAAGLLSLGFKPPNGVKVFLHYGGSDDGPVIEDIRLALGKSGFSVPSKRFITRKTNGDVRYYSTSREISATAAIISNIAAEMLLTKWKVKLDMTPWNLADKFPNHPPENIEVWFPPLERQVALAKD